VKESFQIAKVVCLAFSAPKGFGEDYANMFYLKENVYMKLMK